MNKSIKRTMGLVLALLVAVSMCIDITGVFADETNTNDQNVKAEAKEAQKTQEFKEESKDEPAETVESKSLKVTKASEDKLEISEETKAKDNAVNEGNKTQDVYLLWHHYGKDKGWYNTEDEGKEISFEYVLKFSGKDKNGQTKYNLSTDYRNYNGKIGQELKISVPVDKIESKDGETYTDCEIDAIDIPISEENRIYGGSATLKDTCIATNIVQNMETLTKMVISPGAIILEGDKENIKVRFSVAQIKEGHETYPLYNRNRKPVDAEIDFKEGEEAIALASSNFYRAVFGNQLDLFSPYTGKYKEHKLHADFSGDNKEELNKKYNLDVSGDDIKGWTVILSSKINKGEREEIKDESNYKTIYKNDPTLLKGKTKIKQEGAKGFTRVKTVYYYIQDENGKEEILKAEEPVTEIVNPTDRIVLVGTKIATEDVNKPEKNDNAKVAPKTGDSSEMMMYAGIAALMSMGALLILKKKRSYK
ncbi:MAG: G5 domain-containing protein [Clostridiales bacterium]|nr:G5 domain-containing protein [Clostridiales bacterium]MDY6117626.1 G5 domain-containing protein [Anaerovoracaceae bacterium]